MQFTIGDLVFLLSKCHIPTSGIVFGVGKCHIATTRVVYGFATDMFHGVVIEEVCARWRCMVWCSP